MLKVYRSGAGSGKTYKLGIIYLSLVLQRPDNFRHILGITFTNKAAAELKARVLKFLAILALGQPQDDAKNIRDNLEIEGLSLTEQEAAQKAKEALQLILHNYGEFALSTIDSFMHKVVSTFSFDLHIAHDFNVILDTAPLAEKIADRLLTKVGKNEYEYLTLLLEIILENLIDNEKGYNIRRLLVDTAETLFREDTRHHLDELTALSPKELLDTEEKARLLLNERLERVRELGKNCLQLIQNQSLNLEDFAYGKNGVMGWVHKMSELKNASAIELPLPNRVYSAIIEDNWFSKNNHPILFQNFQSIQEQVKEAIQQIEALLASIMSLNRIATALPSMALMGALANELRELQREENFLHISDFNELIRKVILDEPVPYLYHRLGNRFHHFLFDEFQDTSVSQWHNLVPLLANSLAQNTHPPTAVIVGDGKQSIYRFRNSELMIFEQLPLIYPNPGHIGFREAEKLFENNYTIEPLEVNRRSQKHIVEFNNAFFEKILEHITNDPDYPLLKKVYADLRQEAYHTELKGYVEWNFLSSENGEDRLEEHARMVLDKITELHQAGYAYKDMAVLVRRGTEGQAIASTLSNHNIPVISSDSLLLHTSREVRLVIAWLYYIQNPSDDFFRTQVLSFYATPEKDLYQLIREHQSLDELTARLLGIPLQTLLQKNLYSLCEFLLARASKNLSIHAHSQTFLEYVQRLVQQKKDSLSDFITAWEESGSSWSVSFSGNTDAVQVMTIHKAKGLEFNIVFLPYLFSRILSKEEAWLQCLNADKVLGLNGVQLPIAILASTAKGDKDPVFEMELAEIKQKQLLDQLNLMYVAFTRACERLYIFSDDLNAQSKDLLKNATAHAINSVMHPHHSSNVYTYPAHEKLMHSSTHDVPESLKLPSEEVIQWESQPWENRFKIRRQAPEQWLPGEVIAARKRGADIHHLMERIVDRIFPQTADLEKEKGGLQETTLETVWNEIQNDPLYPEIFISDAEYLPERELLIPGHGLLRPDLLIVKENMVNIVDYKTGAPHISHQHQIQEYAMALKEAGFERINGYLIYLNQNAEIVKV